MVNTFFIFIKDKVRSNYTQSNSKLSTKNNNNNTSSSTEHNRDFVDSQSWGDNFIKWEWAWTI